MELITKTLPLLVQTSEAAGRTPPEIPRISRRCTTTTDSRSRRNRASRRGGELLTGALGSSSGSACRTFVLPVPRSRIVAPYAAILETAAEHRHRESHTGYASDRECVCHCPPSDSAHERLAVPDELPLDGLQTRDGSFQTWCRLMSKNQLPKSSTVSDSRTASRSFRRHHKRRLVGPPPKIHHGFACRAE
ncbi:MAG: hypothetical protein K0S56_653 [Microvirga sp.]|nr:hypothetical protein [Microvirga sp.]